MHLEERPQSVIVPTGLMPSDSVMRSLQSQSDIVEMSKALSGVRPSSAVSRSEPAMGAKSRLGVPGSEGGEAPPLMRDASEKWNAPGPRVSAGVSHSDAWYKAAEVRSWLV